MNQPTTCFGRGRMGCAGPSKSEEPGGKRSGEFKRRKKSEFVFSENIPGIAFLARRKEEPTQRDEEM
jgi:hypothetical protein